MNKTGWIIIGVFALIVMIALIAAILPRMRDSFMRMKTWKYVLIFFLSAGILCVTAVNLFGPKGSESLFAEAGDGDDKGEAAAENKEELNEKYTSGRIGGAVAVVISGDHVMIGEIEPENREQLKAAVKSLKESGENFCVVDDYAGAAAYREVTKLLEDLDIKYSTLERE